MVQKTIVFIDAGFLSKLVKYFGNGKYLSYDIFKLAALLAQKEKLSIEHIFYYTAPPFISSRPKMQERKRKENYDKFIFKLGIKDILTVRQGRCQRIELEDGNFKFSQKGVDTLLTMDLIKVPINYSKIKKIILIACDTDFIPVINDVYGDGVETILYTYYDRVRNSDFSRSNELLQNVSKHVLITKKDITDSKLDSKKT